MIEIKDLKKMYGRRAVVDGVSLVIEKNKVFGFLGQNGAGKTTAMKMMVGLLRPDAGSVSIAGRSVLESETREIIGFMPEAPYFYERLTGFEFLKFCGDLFPRHRKKTGAEYEALLKKVGIFEAKDAPIRNYSKGMKQRLGFAQSLVNDPEYVFLDEPLDGLDPIGRREIKEIIKLLKQEGRTIFLNSHILYDTEELCDEVGVIHKGKLLYAGSVKDFCSGKPLEDQFIATVEAHNK